MSPWPRAISTRLFQAHTMKGFSVVQKLHRSVSCDLENSTAHKEEIWLWHLEGKRLHISHLHPPTLLQLGVNNSFFWGSFQSPLPFTALWLWKPKAVTWKFVKSQRVRKRGVSPSLARDLPQLWAGCFILHDYHKWRRPHWYHINL